MTGIAEQARAELAKVDAGLASEPWAVRDLLAERDALAAEVVAAEADAERLREALSWALDVLEISLQRIDSVDGAALDPEHYRIRDAGLAKARAALAAPARDSEPAETTGQIRDWMRTVPPAPAEEDTSDG